jgi:hypothetical protein
MKTKALEAESFKIPKFTKILPIALIGLNKYAILILLVSYIH